MVTVLRWRGIGAESFVKECNTYTFGSPHCLQGRERPIFRLHHLGIQSQPHADHLAVLAHPFDRLFDERELILTHQIAITWQSAVRLPERYQYFLGMMEIEQICQPTILSLNQTHFQIAKKPTDSQPEIISHHHNALHRSS